ncbi:MAG TPA: FAD-binding protein [Candidatus Thioglobus sp.]|jgi:glycolate oxidase FAD binding subunit|nr:FAD-binding protein [Candidatus Thioglobus sp.]HIB97368.1 FAD-binding protein [Candidatus Thioglobus sp.]
MSDRIEQLQEEVKNSSSIHIDSQWLNYSGIEEYFSEELVITVKAGTAIKEIQAQLEENQQIFPFYITDENQSIGAAYAIGAQDISDSVLGVKIIDGSGELLNFGGQVMKNVAGYDVARMLVGSQGQLAIITQISFKVMPKSYIADLKPSYKENERSTLREEIEGRLKTVFDPRGVFN